MALFYLAKLFVESPIICTKDLLLLDLPEIDGHLLLAGLVQASI